ncbi:MAG: cyclic pyranopterin monophosphate synthase MoaC [Porticoccaceae bacterium]|nr:cyclic pyranopterin monophosphate synthase MoaC [Porticoccaceae bacterium]
MSKLTHLNTRGEAHMVDVSDKSDTARTAIAQSQVQLTAEIVAAIGDDSLPKGDLLATARIAGIQGAKKCSDLIPLCHPLPLSKITVDIELQGQSLVITALCKTTGKTGVEMEALTAVSVAALTVYDMCKGIHKGMIIGETKLLNKTGGKSGDWSAEAQV